MAEEAKNAAEAGKEAPAVETKTEEKKEVKIGDVLETGKPKEEKKEARMVPEAVLIDTKKALKEAEKKIKQMESEGATKGEINKTLEEIATKHNVEPELVKDILALAKGALDAEVDEKVSSKIRPMEEKDRKEKIDKIFKTHYEKALEEMPEFKGIANEAVIKALSLDPANADKSFEQILRESYGHLIKGKKTIETTKPRGGAKDVQVDVERAKTDPEYYKEIMADPQLKAEYNKDLAKRNHF